MSDDEDNGPDPNAWMVVFSDLLSLLMTFFVLLLSMASLDSKKLDETIGAFRAYLGVLEFGDSIELTRMKDNNSKVLTSFKFHDPSVEEGNLKVEVEELIVKEGWSKNIIVHQDANRLVLIFHESIEFKIGSNEVLDHSRDVLKKIVKILLKSDYDVHVEGHTDNRPIDSSRFPSNWELSIARGVKVLKLMESFGMPASRLSVVGYGSSRPMSSNFTLEGRKENRRVELTMMINPKDKRTSLTH